MDFAILAAYWSGNDAVFLYTSGGIDLTNDGNIDLNDLKEFAENQMANTHGNAPETSSSSARPIIGLRYKSVIDNH